MLEMNIRYTVQGVILAFALCVAGAASAQESGSILAAPEKAQRTSSETIPVAAELEAGAGISTTQGNIPGMAISPAPRMTWDSAAPELDAFGNETEPVFNSTYSAK